MDAEIDRVAGTSAGAISASLYALGYSPEEMETALGQKNLLQLLDPKNEICNAILQAILAQKNTQGGIQSIKALLSGGAAHILVSPAQAYRELSRIDGLCKGEDARNWIEELIYSQVKKVTGEEVPFLTFGELRALKARGFPFKHIRIFATSLFEEKPRCFSSENREGDNFIISDVVRASMSIPGVFEPHILHTKEPKTGRRKADPDGGRYVDGGLLRNFPIKTYDEPDGQINRRTLGLSLKKERPKEEGNRDPKTPIELVQALFRIYYDAESCLQNEEDNNRVVEIPTLGVSTLDFDLKKEKVEQLIKSGYDAIITSPLFAPGIDETQNSSRRRTLCAPLSNFTGRSSDIKKLKGCLQNRALPFDKRLIVLLISGLPGIGKTELARKAVDEVLDSRDRSTYAFEFDYRNIDGSYREIARRLEIFFDEKTPSEEVQRKVCHFLEQTKEPWFLIINNVEQDKKVDKELLPESGGYVLVTAHSSEAWSDPDEHVQLGALEPEEGAHLIARIIGEKEVSDEVRQLARRLGHYPLALDQAARFIRGSHPSGQPNNYTVKEYLDLYRRSPIEGGMISNEQRYNAMLKEVWEISFAHLEEKHPEVWGWLRFSSWFSPDNIPIEWIGLWLPGSFENSLVPKAKEIIGVLRSYGLVRELSQEDGGRYFSIHSLFQGAIRTKLTDSPLDANSFQQLTSMILLFSKSAIKKNYKEKEICLFHINFIVDHAINMRDREPLSFAELLQIRGKLRMDRGEYRSALQDFEEALILKQQFYGDQKDRSIAKSLNHLGKACDCLGMPDRAIDFHKKAFEMLEQILGERPDRDIANSLNGLGHAYFSKSKYQIAEYYYKKAFEMRNQIYDKQLHRKIAHSLSNLGNVSDRQENIKEAIFYHQKALEMREQVCNNRSHFEIGDSLNNLGSAYSKAGEHNLAIKCHQEALEIIKQNYGDQPHPKNSNSLNNLGFAYSKKGDWGDAIPYYQRSLEMDKKIYGDRLHSEAAITLNNLGEACFKLRAYEQAINYYEQSLLISKHFNNERNDIIAESLEGLGNIYFSKKNFAKATELFKDSYEIFRGVFGEDQSDTKRVKKQLDAATKAQDQRFCQIL